MEPKSNHYFYVIECADKSWYAGYTTNLTRRLTMHNTGKGAKYTRARRPVHYIYAVSYETKRAAMQMEYQFKQWTRAKKEQYIKEQECFNEVTKKL